MKKLLNTLKAKIVFCADSPINFGSVPGGNPCKSVGGGYC